MLALTQVREVIRKNPDSHAAQVLLSLLEALEREGPFPLGELYSLDLREFQIAIDLLQEWRLDRYCGLARNGRVEPGAEVIDRRKAIEMEDAAPA